jgi:hypothetical protein
VYSLPRHLVQRPCTASLSTLYRGHVQPPSPPCTEAVYSLPRHLVQRPCTASLATLYRGHVQPPSPPCTEAVYSLPRHLVQRPCTASLATLYRGRVQPPSPPPCSEASRRLPPHDRSKGPVVQRGACQHGGRTTRAHDGGVRVRLTEQWPPSAPPAPSTGGGAPEPSDARTAT